MSGGAIASPARCENSTYAPSTDARTAAGTTSRITADSGPLRSEEHTSELQSQSNLVCRLLLEKKKKTTDKRSALSGRGIDCVGGNVHLWLNVSVACASVE